MNLYRLAADLVVVVHAAYVTFVVAGFILIILGHLRNWRWVQNFWFRLIHLTMMGVVVVESLWGLTCPLTTLEMGLRQRAGETPHEASFVGYWAHELLFIDAAPWVFTTGYCLFGALVAATLYWSPPRVPWRRAS